MEGQCRVLTPYISFANERIKTVTAAGFGETAKFKIKQLFSFSLAKKSIKCSELDNVKESDFSAFGEPLSSDYLANKS